MKIKSIGFFLLLSIVIGCRPSTTETTEADSEPKQSNISEITYYDLLTNVFEDDGYLFEYHDEVIPNEFMQLLTVTREGICGSGGCGEGLFVTNSSATDTLAIVVNGVYDLDGNIGNIARQYVVPPNEKVSIGCSHLCFDGKPYEFERTIVGSKVLDEEVL